QDMVGDIEIVAAAEDPALAIEQLSDLPDVGRILHRSARRLYLLVDRVQIGMRFPQPETSGAQLLHLTGSPDHLDALRAVARTRGGRLTIEGYRGPETLAPVARCEEDIYAALGLPFVPPELRDGTEAIDRAREGKLPALVSQADIKGDLHMHSTWSDGRDPIEPMVAMGPTLGYAYCA